jgi:hypothetical protein
MTRSLGRLTLLVGALLALLALTAQAASAHVPARFTSEVSTTTVRGNTDPGTTSTLVITGSNVQCSIEEYHAHTVSTSLESITATPTYTECTAFGFVGAKVTGFGHYPASEGAGPYCDYRLRADGFIDFECPTGKDVTIEASTCTVHIPAQTEIGTTTGSPVLTKHPGVIYTTENTSGKHALTVDVHLTDITATHTDGFACPLTSSGENATTTFDARIQVWGLNEVGSNIGITWDATVA